MLARSRAYKINSMKVSPERSPLVDTSSKPIPVLGSTSPLMSITAGAIYRDAVPQDASTEDQTAADAPVLKGLSHRLAIFTKSSPDFSRLWPSVSHEHGQPPLAVLRPASEDEVAAAVRFCTTSQPPIPFSIRSGGLDPAGRSRTPDGQGLVIDMRSVDSMVIAEDRKTVIVGGGVICGRLVHFLDDNGLATPTAFSGRVGYVSWACSGGYSCLSGKYGLGVDQIEAGRVVLADGRIVDTDDAHADPDVLWALRGAGAGIVGVVVQLRIKVYPRPPILAGHVIFPLAGSAALFGKLGELNQRDLPDGFAGDVMIVRPPGTDGIVDLFFHWILKDDKSDMEEAYEYLKQLESLGTPISSSVSETTPRAFIDTIPNPDIYRPLVFFMRQCDVAGWSHELGEILAGREIPFQANAVIVHSGHGAIVRERPDACFRDRPRHLMLGFVGAGPRDDARLQRASKDWVVGLDRDVREAGLALPSQYMTFVEPLEGAGLRYYGAEGLERVKCLKERLDPTNRFPQNTPDLGD
ncbi:hypothetical protein VTK73DRAFT_989 [Phialemonium thermophilum]|uniref:FAD-binding PCMH-type domain-containing protein n=1 Tax=Phialemonium thermophilum TaxID=223376 RepID=A0ABR3XBX9_9PEZI